MSLGKGQKPIELEYEVASVRNGTRPAVALWIAVAGIVIGVAGNGLVGTLIVRVLSSVPRGTTVRPMGLAVALAFLSFALAGAGVGAAVISLVLDARRLRTWILALLCLAVCATPILGGTAFLFRLVCDVRGLIIGD